MSVRDSTTRMYWLIVLFERQQAASPAPQYHLLEEIRQCGYRCEVTKLIGTLKIVPAGLESVPKAVGGTYLFMAGKENSALFRRAAPSRWNTTAYSRLPGYSS
jgi:hypothetical protein